MASRPLPPSPPTIAHYNGTLQWHPPKLVVTLPPTIAHYNGTPQWHPNGQQWHHVHSPKVGRYPPPAMAPPPLPQSWSPSPLTIAHSMAPYDGIQQSDHHPAVAPWCHVQSAKVVRRPPPLLEVRTPIAIAIWGIKHEWTYVYIYIHRNPPYIQYHLQQNPGCLVDHCSKLTQKLTVTTCCASKLVQHQHTPLSRSWPSQDMEM